MGRAPEAAHSASGRSGSGSRANGSRKASTPHAAGVDYDYDEPMFGKTWKPRTYEVVSSVLPTAGGGHGSGAKEAAGGDEQHPPLCGAPAVGDTLSYCTVFLSTETWQPETSPPRLCIVTSVAADGANVEVRPAKWTSSGWVACGQQEACSVADWAQVKVVAGPSFEASRAAYVRSPASLCVCVCVCACVGSPGLMCAVCVCVCVWTLSCQDKELQVKADAKRQAERLSQRLMESRTATSGKPAAPAAQAPSNTPANAPRPASPVIAVEVEQEAPAPAAATAPSSITQLLALARQRRSLLQQAQAQAQQ